ncbi:GPW/gp25 family protein [Enterobacteriaceae bacterium H11S18]|uniref:type VI secretion system baseplate subunit TssE n=1 Tax=Dryocola clanedunensis TaxID=2925396 RepID=UPI0022F0D80C|nr:GPW/gp25 family protein [Dryocola clanedunensis]MCT4710208.1 GPW/gp25 family protein [Dryocola clanedunensis]
MKGTKQQFLPTLFDRLLDDEPKNQKEAADKYFFSSREMRKIVQRDIIAILNNSNIEAQLHQARHQQVMESVLNYGIATMPGTYVDAGKWAGIEKVIRNAIVRFEPRVIPESLVVRPLRGKEAPSRHGTILFEIRGLIWWSPAPVDLCFSGAYDSEMEQVSLSAD